MTKIEVLQARIRELEEALIVRCDCGEPAICNVEWSDREGYVCGKAECLRKKQHNHDFDHLYDQIRCGPRINQYWHQHPVLNLNGPDMSGTSFLSELFARLHPGLELRPGEMWKVRDHDDSLPKCEKCGCLVMDGCCVNRVCPGKGGK